MAVSTCSTAEKSCSRAVMLFVLSFVNVSSNVYFVHSILDNCQKFSYSCLIFFALDTFPVFISYDDATVFFFCYISYRGQTDSVYISFFFNCSSHAYCIRFLTFLPFDVIEGKY